MAFFQLVLKARKLEKARLKYEDEKLTSIAIAKGAKARFTLSQRLRRIKIRFKKKVKTFCGKIFAIPKNLWLYRKIVAICTSGTLENYIAKSFLGFIGGMFLTYIFFAFFVLQLNFRLSTATFLCTVIGVILTLGLAFSPRIRCIVFLLLPQFFSKRGRQVLMAYAFILALTGPVKNTLHNVAVLSESLTCAQEQLKEAVKTVVDIVKQPFYALRDVISKVIKSIKAVVKRIKQTLLAIKRIVLSILRVITSVFQWLGSVINMCNKKLGTPFDRCQSVFDGAISDCKAKLGPIIGVVCNVTYVVSSLCYIVKPLDFICMLVSYIADSVVGAVRRKIKRFTMHMKAMFYVKVKFAHSFHYETNQSKAIEEVSTGIVTEVRSRTDQFFAFFDLMSCLTSLLAFVIVLRVLRYRYKWLTSERFDNRYITEDLRTIDLVRARQDKETVLPLNSRERNHYASLSSVMLIKSEKVKLVRSVVFLGLATIKIISYIMIDYSLYWILNIIQIHGRFQSKVERPSVVTVHVSGDGYLADLYRSIVRAFTPHGKEAELDTMLCLPEPVPPDLDKYTRIIALLIFSWLIAIFEPYGLRLRHVVLCQYYPDRAKQRAAWLYNQIIRSRGSFLKFARRQLRRKFGLGKGEPTEKVTFKERLWAVCPWLNICFPHKQNMCLLCGAPERSDEPHIKCRTPGCVGLFCTQCYADLQNLCTICRSPIDYGDLSDISEEKDSSDDPYPVAKKKEAKPEEQVEKPEVEETDEGVDEEEETDEYVDEEEEPLIKKDDEKRDVKKVVDEKQEEKGEKEEDEELDGERVAEEKVAKIEKDVAQQTDVKHVEDSDRSSESSYSYTYQDESPKEEEIKKRRPPFKDVEAQKIRDDVTIQIFNEPFVKETSSSSESSSCFVVRARRRVRARLEKPPCRLPPGEKDSDSSTSIADTESWSSEEVDEEEVIHIEADDCSEELLPKDRRDKKKRGRINRIVGAVAKIPWLGKEEDDEKACRDLRTRRPSLMNKIVSMLRRKQSMPVQTYKRTRKIKDSSSSSLSCDDENAVLKMEDSSCDTRRLVRRKFTRKSSNDDSNREKNLNLKQQGEKKFITKQLPRYLESTAKGTAYFEVDETKGSRIMTGKCVRQVEDVNELSGVRPSSDSTEMNTWNISNSDEFVGPCSCTSEITQETTDEKVNIYSLGMNTISEHTDDTSKTVNETETQNETTVTESTTENTEGTESLADTLEKRNAKAPSYHGKFDESSEYEGQSDLEETKKETTNVSETGRNEVRMKGGASMKEDARRSIARRGTEKTSTLAEEDSTKLLDPLAGLEVFDVHKKSKRRPRRTGLETIMKREVEEKKIEENNAEEKVTKEEKAEKKKTKEKEAEDEKGTDKNAEEKRTMEKKAEKKETEEPPDVDDKTKKRSVDAQTVGSKMDKATDLPDKSKYTQTKFHKYDGKMKSENTGRDSVTPDAKGSEKDLKEEVTEGKDKSSKRKKRGEKRVEKDERVKCSKRKKLSCSEKSILSDDEEIYCVKRKRGKRKTKLKCEDEKSPRRSRWKQSSEKDRLDKATAVLCERSTDRRRETEKWNQSTDKYSPYDRRTQYPVQQYSDQFSRMGDVSWNDRFEENDFSWTCRSHPCNYQPDICSKCVSERRDDVFRHLRDSTESSIRSSNDRNMYCQDKPSSTNNSVRRFEMPMVKKYLPMYQSPELIEELKKHDRMKLIREREARSRRQASSPRTPVSVSVCSKIGYQKPKRIVTCHPPGSLVDEDNRLPYQETQAYKNVLCEFRKTEHRRRPENREETEPLINLSKRADKSKKVKQLYPSPGRKRKKSDTVKKFANKIITSIRPVTCKKHKCKSHAQNLTLEEMDTSRYDYSLDPEVLSDVSPCKCSKEASTSADETTDNNDSTQ